MKVCDLTVEIHYFSVKSFAKHCQIIRYGPADILLSITYREKSMEDKMIALDFIQNQIFSVISLSWGVLVTE